MDNHDIKKDELLFFAQNLLGGAPNFCYNLLQGDREGYFDKKTILIDCKESVFTRRFTPWDVSEHTVFGFANMEIVYDVSKRLSKLISNLEGVVVTSFVEELRTLDIFRRPAKTIFFVAHDGGYVRLAVKYEFLIDVFIAHNICIYDELVAAMPNRKADIFFLPYGIKLSTLKRKPNLDKPLKILFLARFDVKKGIHDLFEMDRLLKEKNIVVEWTLIGDGPEKERVLALVKASTNFTAYRVDDNNELFNHICRHDIFILPSRLDGVPVSLLETMSCGLVPVLSEFNTGIIKVVPPEVGFVLPVGDNQIFVDTIAALNNDRGRLEQLSANAAEHTQAHYDVNKTSVAYYELFKNHRSHRREKQKSPIKHRKLLDILGVSKQVRSKIKTMLSQ
ncbi:MAG: glycosyltransferase family 4 protein [Chitinophagaceae bacterium]